MGTVKRLAEEVERGLREIHPKLRKTVVSKLALAVGAMIEGQTPNTVELANLLPLETERQKRGKGVKMGSSTILTVIALPLEPCRV